MKLSAEEKQMLHYYHEFMKFYLQTTNNVLTDVTEREIEAVSVASQLAEFIEVTPEEWVHAQFYWWDLWFKDIVPLAYIGTVSSMKRRHDSVWRTRHWVKLKDTNESTSRPVGPLSGSSFEEMNTFLVNKLKRAIEREESLSDTIMALPPCDAYYLFSEKARTYGDNFLDTFSEIKQAYVANYKSFPGVEAFR
jgi:hypothetical protein